MFCTYEPIRHIHEFATPHKMPEKYLNDQISSQNMFCDLTMLKDPVCFLQSASNARGNRNKINCQFCPVYKKGVDTLVLRALKVIEPGEELLGDYWDE